MTQRDFQRYYASEQYLLPADKVETERLNIQHGTIVKAFGNKLSLIPIDLISGDRVLESAAGTGIWALEFFESNKKNGVLLDIQCSDISDRQFLGSPSPNIHFSLHSVTDFPAGWSDTFTFAHQRFIVGALTETLWRQAVGELFRVLSPGGWLELVEMDLQNWLFDVGPSSNKLRSIMMTLYAESGVIVDLPDYLPRLLKEVGFLDVQCEVRAVPLGSKQGYRSEEFGELCRGFTGPMLRAGLVGTEAEYEDILQGSVQEWDLNSLSKPSIGCCTILARKP
ncbi:hypothetical protein D9757_009706 [Collybiopsis confluens]|uniref:S-adenosyl-L-methionine-dependent methyltransferase n=1 Tax=Collybiopsis confluens TaxID=2823264 RepID=A0A8H5H6P5_9AGAR|nr:hypothetical protein D9757_009706 [Collybiopsis confluens]